MTPSDMWLRLLPIAVVSAIAPLKISAMILLFRTPRGGLTGAAYVAGVAGAMLSQGIVMVSIFAIFGVFAALDREASEAVSFGLLVVLGMLMLVGALRLRYHDHDDDRPPHSWMEGIESFSPQNAFSLGFGWAFISPKQWIFTLAALAILYFADLGRVSTIANYVVFVAVATSNPLDPRADARTLWRADQTDFRSTSFVAGAQHVSPHHWIVADFRGFFPYCWHQWASKLISDQQ